MCSVQQRDDSRKYETKQIMRLFSEKSFSVCWKRIAFFKHKEAALKIVRNIFLDIGIEAKVQFLGLCED